MSIASLKSVYTLDVLLGFFQTVIALDQSRSNTRKLAKTKDGSFIACKTEEPVALRLAVGQDIDSVKFETVSWFHFIEG